MHLLKQQIENRSGYEHLHPLQLRMVVEYLTCVPVADELPQRGHNIIHWLRRKMLTKLKLPDSILPKSYSLRPESLVAEMDVPRRIFSS